MSGRHARSGHDQVTAGGIILVIISFVSAVLMIASLVYGTGISERHKAALAAAGCEPNLSPSGLPCTTVWMLARQYTTLTTPVIQQLNTEAAAYISSEADDLAAAEVALTAEVRTENAFGASLARFPFPPAVAHLAMALIQHNQVRANLTAEQALSSSLTKLQSFDDRVKAASAAVQTEITLIRRALNSRPTANQEPLFAATGALT
jgi:hypothetical protein